jgi:hypothetical protein
MADGSGTQAADLATHFRGRPRDTVEHAHVARIPRARRDAHMATNLTRLRPATLTIDGQVIKINCRRLKLEEAEAHRVFMKRLFSRSKEEEDHALAPDDAAQMRAAIEAYITIPPGELSVDNEPVTTGAQLLDVIGESSATLLRALLAIMGVSRVSESEGLPSASESVLVPSSDAPAPAPVGPRPVTTATAVEPAATALIEDATAATARPSSGETETLN